jgi:hypothetical protein
MYARISFADIRMCIEATRRVSHNAFDVLPKRRETKYKYVRLIRFYTLRPGFCRAAMYVCRWLRGGRIFGRFFGGWGWGCAFEEADPPCGRVEGAMSLV